MHFNRSIKQVPRFLLLGLIALAYAACKPKPAPVKQKPSFKLVHGIGFTEVRRAFKSGISFSDQGFQLEPDWRLTFLSDDSVNIYSPEKKKFFNCPVIFDHDSIFNVAWAWMRLKKVTKDSIKFQVLEVEDKAIMDDKSVVYMTLYSDHYIKDVLHSDSATLVKPSRQDTLFIKHKTQLADSDPKYAFSARIPASLKSKSPMLTVQKTSVTKDVANNITIADDYLTPRFNIVIRKAYDDFNYPFVILVDSKGQLHFSKSSIDMSMSPEFAEPQNRVMKAITDGYLKHYLDVTPGTTLGIPHATKIMVNVKGIKG
ncbi:hypothetical protein [Mucilaginibacter paludis]|uniref:Lipoprotein n=1 Tax=Mucilaginibacter paludis DSM 18603 TaxID=714943 RepID=H1XZZ2_9SPHI|nr:hypothetical protein [Mucilaginibacter paludis]EHQ27834.1 hypothetical protein Mucpa_3736 [Mucilaginibacter paludis DSM 18603]